VNYYDLAIYQSTATLRGCIGPNLSIQCYSGSSWTGKEEPEKTCSPSHGRGLPRQAYFEYDAKKSGGVTISHLRFGPQPIYAPQLGWTDAWCLPSWWHVPILLMVGWLMDADGCYTCYRWLTMAGWLMMDDR